VTVALGTTAPVESVTVPRARAAYGLAQQCVGEPEHEKGEYGPDDGFSSFSVSFILELLGKHQVRSIQRLSRQMPAKRSDGGTLCQAVRRLARVISPLGNAIFRLRVSGSRCSPVFSDEDYEKPLETKRVGKISHQRGNTAEEHTYFPALVLNLQIAGERRFSNRQRFLPSG